MSNIIHAYAYLCTYIHTCILSYLRTNLLCICLYHVRLIRLRVTANSFICSLACKAQICCFYGISEILWWHKTVVSAPKMHSWQWVRCTPRNNSYHIYRGRKRYNLASSDRGSQQISHTRSNVKTSKQISCTSHRGFIKHLPFMFAICYFPSFNLFLQNENSPEALSNLQEDRDESFTAMTGKHFSDRRGLSVKT